MQPQLTHTNLLCFCVQVWWGWFWKIGNDCSQFGVPLRLNKLFKSMQLNEPAWIGYIYAISIFFGVVFGVLCAAQYFPNVMRVGYRLRSAPIAHVIQKSLRLTNEGRKKFQTENITNLMTTDTEPLHVLLDDEGHPDEHVIRKLFETIDADKDIHLSTAELKALIIGISFEDIGFDKDDAVEKILHKTLDEQVDQEEFDRGTCNLI